MPSTSGRPSSERELVAFDLETTGSTPGRDAIIEIGAAKRVDGKIETFDTFVDPRRPIPPFIRRLTGIRQSDVAQAPSQEEALGAFLDFAGHAVLVAHNAPFDKGFLKASGMDPGLPVVDSLFFSRLAIPLEESHGLEAHARRTGRRMHHHRAGDDAVFTLELMEGFMASVRALPAGLRSLMRRLAAGDDDLDLLAGLIGELGPSEVWGGPKEVPVGARPGPLPALSFAETVRRLGLEERPGQEELHTIATAIFDEGGVAMVEAGTGTGKSLAYLLAAVRAAEKRKSRAIVSTQTHNLQGQLMTKDIPQLEEVTGPLGAVLLKGQGNYLCLLRWEADLRNAEGEQDTSLKKEHLRVLTWLQETVTGEREELPGLPYEVWGRINVEAETCTRERCPHYAECFFYRRHRAAEAGRLVIVNHALLVADALSGGMVLPEADLLVVDEAHNLEPQAMEMIGTAASEAAVRRDLEEAAKMGRAETRQAVLAAGDRLTQLCRAIEGSTGLRRTTRLDAGTLLNLPEGLVTNTVAAFSEVVRTLKDVADETGGGEAGDVSRSGYVLGLAARVAAWAEAIAACLEGGGEVRWVETGRHAGQVVFRTSPIEVGPTLRERLFERFEGTLLTSATLAVGESFDHALKGLGLDEVPDVTTTVIPSPFFYADQALLGIVTDLPDPRQEGFQEEAAAFLRDLLPLSPGGSMVLFTSHQQLRHFSSILRDDLAERGIELLAQNEDGSRPKLLERLRRGGRVVLFGAQSFWEGVDVQGPALSLLVMMRLPFAPPDHPVRQARSERIESEGGSSFDAMSLPEAVLHFKQGFGRLIRSSEDLGAVVVMDPRLATKRYGQAFLDSIPGPSTIRGGRMEVLESVRRWFT